MINCEAVLYIDGVFKTITKTCSNEKTAREWIRKMFDNPRFVGGGYDTFGMFKGGWNN